MPEIKKYLSKDGLEDYNERLPHSATQMQEYVADWLDAHPEATTTVQDGSITDPKLAQTGGVLSEVHNIREGYDGTTYTSAGDAVRAQVTELHSVTDNISRATNLLDASTVVDDSFWKNWGNGITVGSSGYIRVPAIEVKAGISYSSTKMNKNFSYFGTNTTTPASWTQLINLGVSSVVADNETFIHLENFIPSEDGYLFITTNDEVFIGAMLVNSASLPDTYCGYGETAAAYVYGVEIVPVNDEAVDMWDSKEQVHYMLNTITVDASGSGDYTSVVDAFNSILDNNQTNRHLIKVKAGTYDFGDDFTLPANSPVGIYMTKPYVYFEGENPNTTILYFNGCPYGMESITDVQAMNVSLFNWGFGNAYKGWLKNFTFRVKNGRYCIHPETAGKGNGGDWLIENCIFDFLGNPNVESWAGASLGIGISHGEKGKIVSCKWVNSNVSALVGHNNGYDYSDNPVVIPNAELTFKHCDFGGANVNIDNYIADSGFHDILKLYTCKGILRGWFGAQYGQTDKTWICINEGSIITIDDFDY